MARDKLTVTKIDAAVRQLRTAIRLWFQDGDPVAIHTLAAAAHEIADTLLRKRGEPGLLFNNHLIKDEFKKDFNSLLKSWPNFFKHANRDHEASIVFDTILNEAIITFTVYGISRIDHKAYGPDEQAFVCWLALHRPDVLVENPLEKVATAEAQDQMRTLTKGEFFLACRYGRYLRDRVQNPFVLGVPKERV